MRMKPLVEGLYSFEKHLNSDGIDEAFALLEMHLPGSAYRINYDYFRPGTRCWTWTIPPRYKLHRGYIASSGGITLVDSNECRLSVMSYSQPIDAHLTWDELKPHIHCSKLYTVDENAIPYQQSVYKPDWGFCVSQAQYDQLQKTASNTHKLFHVKIDAEFTYGQMRVGTLEIPGNLDWEILVAAHICHPGTADDDCSGCAVIMELAHRFAQRPIGKFAPTVRFLWCPETIGSIAWFSRHEELIDKIHYGFFVDMAGNQNQLGLQRSYLGDSEIDRIAESEFAERFESPRLFDSQQLACNDEQVFESNGVEIPSISVSRFPYKEYHTSLDTPAIISEDSLIETADVMEAIIRKQAKSYRPVPLYKGPVFLQDKGMWIDWQESDGMRKLNARLNDVMRLINGVNTVMDIAVATDLDINAVDQFIMDLHSCGLVRIQHPLKWRTKC